MVHSDGVQQHVGPTNQTAAGWSDVLCMDRMTSVIVQDGFTHWIQVHTNMSVHLQWTTSMSPGVCWRRSRRDSNPSAAMIHTFDLSLTYIARKWTFSGGTKSWDSTVAVTITSLHKSKTIQNTNRLYYNLPTLWLRSGSAPPQKRTTELMHPDCVCRT